MMIWTILSWIATLFILLGFYFNMKALRNEALVAWVLGDVMWIIYDIRVDNYSHAVLSTIIILMNLNAIRRKNEEQ